eukprot:TRINITY_DN7332_c0_g1_i1.p1 TRINITY_DN7332_c0_g1~~TRINITY_DN7332_c0_g1_i1.p1  ORF type:complete len:369 (+),score=58.95 TRINITY_DN7332_c0_g1_i1:69-1109(+)
MASRLVCFSLVVAAAAQSVPEVQIPTLPPITVDVPAVLQNIGADCWTPCNETSGYCSFCGRGNACCRKNITDAPPECKGPVAYTTWHHQCVTPIIGQPVPNLPVAMLPSPALMATPEPIATPAPIATAAATATEAAPEATPEPIATPAPIATAAATATEAAPEAESGDDSDSGADGDSVDNSADGDGSEEPAAEPKSKELAASDAGGAAAAAAASDDSFGAAQWAIVGAAAAAVLGAGAASFYLSGQEPKRATRGVGLTAETTGRDLETAELLREPTSPTNSAAMPMMVQTPSPEGMLGMSTAYYAQQPNYYTQSPGMGSAACPMCGNVYAPDSNFCRKCGHQRMA